MSLNEKVRVTWSDLEVGRQLLWDIYTESGKLLLKAGQTIPSQQVLEGMCKYILYRYVKDGNTAHTKKQRRVNVFAELSNLVLRQSNIFIGLDEGDTAMPGKIENLVSDIQSLCQNEADAVIAAFHLPNEYDYSVFHSIQCAILGAFISNEEGFSDHEQKMVIAAALTANAGMHKLQDLLAKQGGALTVGQDEEIKRHPEQSVKLLRAVGVNDKMWLSIIMQHHERGDGSGYPEGLLFSEIGKGALILAIADRYGAMVSTRDYRKPLFIKDALSAFLLDKGKAYDSRYALQLIKIFSIFPPGSFVTLDNGEIAIVVKRGIKNPMKPIVKSILGPDKKRYSKPLFRECGRNGYEVDGLTGFDPNIPLNYSSIWEYN